MSLSLKPLGDRVVARRLSKPDETVINGILLPDSAVKAPQEYEVAAVGPGKRREDGTLTKMTLKVGDRFITGEYTGSEVEIDDVSLLVLRQEEVWATRVG